MRTVINAPAKINLFLEITTKRPDAYHNIVTLMHPVPIFDTIAIETNDSGEITVFCSNPDIPADKSNLAYKAAAAFFEKTGISPSGVDIAIEKRIPAKAGLAGGSTDGAAVLNGLNDIYGSPLSDEELVRLGATIGADVPFCLIGKPMLCKGIGDIMIPSPALPPCHIVVSVPETGMQTEKAYFLIDRLKKRRINTADFLSVMESGDLQKIAGYSYNCFESVYPRDDRIADIITSAGALTCRLSGSGSAVFGIFDSEDQAKNACDRLTESGLKAFLCDMSRI